MQNYTKLKAGDVRQEGDEYQHEEVLFYERRQQLGQALWSPQPFKMSSWYKIENLFGHVILLADLTTHAFRRPL